MSYASSNLIGQDLGSIDLSGQSLAKSILTDCKFGKCIGTQFFRCSGQNVDFTDADITDTNFDKAESGIILSLIGSIWNGQRITHVSDWISQEHPRWCFVTNAFVSVGCMQRRIDEWEQIGQSKESLAAWASNYDQIDVEATWDWWQLYAPKIRTWLSANVD